MKQLSCILILFAALAWPAMEARSDNAKTLYTCGMHPQIIQDHPGNCPICGMKLEPVRNGAGAETNPAGSAVIAVDAATRQNMNIRTAEVQRGPLRRTIRTVGNVEHSEAATVDVTTKFKGWVEKLYVDSTGQQVHRGDPLFEIYSPELYSAEAEYVLALNSGSTNDPGVLALRETAAQKLKFFDVPEAQILELERSRTPLKTLPVFAPIDGYVMEKMVVQGQMVEPGMKLYELVNHDLVWVLAQVYEQDLPLIQPGQEVLVSVTSQPGAQFRGRIAFIYPTLDEKTRTATIRAEFHNPGHLLKPGMFATVQIVSELEPSAVLVPESAVLRSGEKNTVFIALAGGKFEARDVTLGVEAENDLVQVTSGLNAGERVVTSGQFLLDSESQLREAIDKMRGPTTTARPETNSVISSDAPAVIAPVKTEALVYVCPMPEHASIIYDHAGNCPICGMALVPVLAQPDAIQQSTNPVIHSSAQNSAPPNTSSSSAPKQRYYCPMHPGEIFDEPGKCPICQMDLVPMPESAKLK